MHFLAVYVMTFWRVNKDDVKSKAEFIPHIQFLCLNLLLHFMDSDFTLRCRLQCNDFFNAKHSDGDLFKCVFSLRQLSLIIFSAHDASCWLKYIQPLMATICNKYFLH